jgi:FdhE protein
MIHNGWQRRIERARELGSQYGFASQILRYYEVVAQDQRDLFIDFERANARLSGPRPAPDDDPFSRPLPPQIMHRFRPFLETLQKACPDPIREFASQLRDGGDQRQFELLTSFWNQGENGGLPPGPSEFCARAFLQPHAASLRSRFQPMAGPTAFRCPFCHRKPGVAVLRPLGDGGQRFLVCSLCLWEWEFRRILCPGCGEEDHAKLPVYVAEELKHVRVEGCDTCRSYIKSVDMTRNGLAEPTVDEMASVPLDLWAQQQGYAKLQPNLMQL